MYDFFSKCTIAILKRLSSLGLFYILVKFLALWHHLIADAILTSGSLSIPMMYSSGAQPFGPMDLMSGTGPISRPDGVLGGTDGVLPPPCPTHQDWILGGQHYLFSFCMHWDWVLVAWHCPLSFPPTFPPPPPYWVWVLGAGTTCCNPPPPHVLGLGPAPPLQSPVYWGPSLDPMCRISPQVQRFHIRKAVPPLSSCQIARHIETPMGQMTWCHGPHLGKRLNTLI